MHILSSMSIKAKRQTVLNTLIANRELHAKIVQEARVGYINRAQELLLKKLDVLRSGKAASLAFAIRVPVDCTYIYDTAIKMLELHEDGLIELDAGQVRNLMQDQWDWTDAFYQTNSTYSSTAGANWKKKDDDE